MTIINSRLTDDLLSGANTKFTSLNTIKQIYNPYITSIALVCPMPYYGLIFYIINNLCFTKTKNILVKLIKKSFGSGAVE